MEQQIQTILSFTFDQNLNTEDEEMIIKKLYKLCFKQSLKQEQICKINLIKTSFQAR